MEAEARQRVEETGWTKELLYQLVNSVREYAIFSSGLDGHIVSWNIGAEKIFGYDAAEALGMDTRLLFTEEDRVEGVPEKEMAIARTNGYSEDERWHLRKDGSLFFASGIQTAVYDGNNQLTGYAKIARDLTERIRFQEELAAAHDALEIKVGERTSELSTVNERLRTEIINIKRSEELRIALLRKIVGVQETERKRIARDIHDLIGQQMTALQLKLGHLGARVTEDAELKKLVGEIQAAADKIDGEVDFLAWELRPSVLDDIGLPAALAHYTREWSEHFSTPAQFHQTGLNGTEMLPETETNLYRIAQEALNNVAKHASATRVSVLLEKRSGMVSMIVEDDGVGFSPDAGETNGDRGMGILGMKERADLVGGTIEIESSPGVGTTVFARVPVEFDGLEQARDGREDPLMPE
ncbi:MAG TPA: PAS domain-containing sensor histidine kinase [Pyrinomonadaceae bacterium]|nr:PAS domain-containing sensor histidine kinase [Pyrinomonadaceae bacterium]